MNIFPHDRLMTPDTAKEGEFSAFDKTRWLVSKKVEFILQLLGTALTLLFFTSGISYLVLGRWATTHQDFWRLYETFLNRSWLYSTLLKYNGHSHFFPSQIWLTDLRLFAANQDLLFTIGLTLELISIVILVMPAWLDRTISLTHTIAATLAIVLGNLWMARASMTGSGAFNCCYSLTLLGAAVAFLSVGTMAVRRDKWMPLTLLVICSSFVASLSFGTGLATWAAVLLLGYCMNVRPRALVAIGAAAVITAVIYTLLPAREAGAHLIAAVNFHSAATYSMLLHYFCRLLGSPFAHAVAGWSNVRNPSVGNFAGVSLCAGAIGFGLIGALVFREVLRRDLCGGLKATGFALTTFTFTGIALITLARAKHISEIPAELDAPRYIFWSSLFWTGLMLIGLADPRQWLRWPVLATVLIVPVFLFPSHYKEGARARFVRYLSENAATSLINGVHDTRNVGVLFPPSADQVYRVANQLRRYRMDMFVDGLQDWIGKKDADLFHRKPVAGRMKGTCRIDAYVTGDDGATAARVIGWVLENNNKAPRRLVFVDERGIICGIARTFSTSDFINQILYAKKFARSSFLGYVRHYDPARQYAMRTADEQTSADGSMLIPEPAKNIPSF
jgi:hypothetical protein